MPDTYVCERFSNVMDAMPPSTLEKLPSLKVDSRLDARSMDVPISMIISREAHELEKEKIWRKAWQFVCREENIPEVGDQHVYDICDQSFLIVRSSPTEIKAFVNSCPHRGRALREFNGNSEHIRCPFHSFTWNLEGDIKRLPCFQEFTGANHTTEAWKLPEAKVGTWGGFVFINPDLNAEPLESYLGDMAQHFTRWDLSNRYISAHAHKIVPCNWKVAQEAFMESFHVSTTHPQAAAAQNNHNTKNDVFGNASRHMALLATPSPDLKGDVSNQDVIDALLDRLPDEPEIMSVPEGAKAREFMAAAQRERLRATVGDSVDDLEVTELVDIVLYTVFPNFHPWGFFNELVYRFRPNGDDHRTSIMEVWYLATFEEGKRPAPAPTTFLTIDQWFVDAPELGNLARVFDQDVYNFPSMQKGLEATRKGAITLTSYQELKIAHFYKLHAEWLGYADALKNSPSNQPERASGAA